MLRVLKPGGTACVSIGSRLSDAAPFKLMVPVIGRLKPALPAPAYNITSLKNRTVVRAEQTQASLSRGMDFFQLGRHSFTVTIVFLLSLIEMDRKMTVSNTTITHEKNQPALFGHLGQTHVMMAESGLGSEISILIELRASQINQCAYCVNLHLGQARKAGIATEKLDNLVVWRDCDHFSPAERAVLAWTEALTHLDQNIDFGPLRNELSVYYSDSEISLITTDIGMINLWNRVQRSKH